jgi:hypothetical protein
MPPNLNVFINCPFDDLYRPILEAIVFAVHDCGFIARSALEISDGSQVRIDKIYQLIGECRFGVHDISLTTLDRSTGLPRFNMPLELGIFLGAKRYGNASFRQKRCLVLTATPYQHQQYCSDIAGQDVAAHENEPDQALRAVRNWLRTHSRRQLPGASHIAARYDAFRAALPALCADLQQDINDLGFNDLTTLIAEWLQVTAPKST